MPTDPALADLAVQLNGLDADPVLRWSAFDAAFRCWASATDPCHAVRRHLADLPPGAAPPMAAATHVARCLRDVPDEPFSFWLHTYRPQRDWLRGYAESVHNHRYHLSSTVLSGSYEHERFDVAINARTGLIDQAGLKHRGTYCTGDAGALLFTEFHRIPAAADGTAALLVKSRAIAPWSLSFDPSRRRGYRHAPAAERVVRLVGDSSLGRPQQ
ncbi:hypothetical protein [Pseudonocardia sp. GCM10023141]|uniref:hypothetical protein n=1 Tax=Pseudonocardia sp. GCM10023141 TaxID=3252653 RepID=UPI00360F7BCD